MWFFWLKFQYVIWWVEMERSGVKTIKTVKMGYLLRTVPNKCVSFHLGNKILRSGHLCSTTVPHHKAVFSHIFPFSNKKMQVGSGSVIWILHLTKLQFYCNYDQLCSPSCDSAPGCWEPNPPIKPAQLCGLSNRFYGGLGGCFGCGSVVFTGSSSCRKRLLTGSLSLLAHGLF